MLVNFINKVKDRHHLIFFKAPKIQLAYPLTLSSRLQDYNYIEARFKSIDALERNKELLLNVQVFGSFVISFGNKDSIRKFVINRIILSEVIESDA